MKYQVFLLLVLLGPMLCSQTTIDIKGQIIDSETGLPIPYVNIGVVGKGLGTVSDENGVFNFNIDDTSILDETVQVSSLGYFTKKFMVREIVDTEFIKIFLSPDITSLKEVVVSVERTENYKSEIIGFPYAGIQKIGYWKGNGALGGELVTKIKAYKKTRKLNYFKFHIKENTSDSLLMRINIYHGNTIVPRTKLNTKNIYHTLKKRAGMEEVDLTPYNIYVEDDFMIGLELLKVHGAEDIGLVLSATDTPGISFRRYASQGEWEIFRGDAMTFSLETSVIVTGHDLDEIKKEQSLMALQQSIEANTLEVLQQINGRVFTELSGMVFDEDNNPIVNAQVGILGSHTGTRTDEFGRYQILARVGDKVSITYMGLESATIDITQNTLNGNAHLYRKTNNLDNVTIIAEKRLRKTEKEKFNDYESNYQLVKSRGGTLDKSISGTAIEIVEIEKQRTVNPNIVQLLAFSFSGVSLGDSGTDTEFGYTENRGSVLYMRGRASILNPRPAIYEVDGVIFNTPPTNLNTQDIKRMAKIPGPMATAKYGSAAAGGIFIINTTVANHSPMSAIRTGDKQVINDNVYQNDALPRETYNKSLPQYMIDISKAITYDGAIEIIESYRQIYTNAPYFYLDTIEYLMGNWSGSVPQDIWEKGEEVLMQQEKYALALAFILDRYESHEKALSIYEELYGRKANSSQSYMNLAKSYADNKRYHRSAEIYARYNYLLEENFLIPDTLGSHRVIETDFLDFLKKHGDKLDLALPKEVNASKLDNRSIRMVFEWNDPMADFTLQFVGPDGKYFTWNNLEDHSFDYESNHLSSKQFEIDANAETVNWSVNATYNGNQNLTPTYVKVTIYYDFGQPSERKEIRLFRMGLKNIKHGLFRINGSGIN